MASQSCFIISGGFTEADFGKFIDPNVREAMSGLAFGNLSDALLFSKALQFLPDVVTIVMMSGV